MSLIQEALKKQQEEARKASLQAGPPSTQGPAAPEPPPVHPQGRVPSLMPQQPPPPPEQAPVETPPSAEETPAQSRFGDKRTIMILVGVASMALILVGGGIWIFKSIRESAPKPQDTATKASTALTSPTAATPLQNATNVVESESPAVEPQEATPSLNESAGTEQRVEDIPQEPAVEPPPVSWPALTVTGVIGKGVKGSAIINGKIVDVGQRINDVKVVSIGMQTVELEYRGKKRTVRTGNTPQ